MSAPSAARTTPLQAMALLTGFLVVMAYAMVGAWPMSVAFGLPPLVAAVLVPRAPRAAAVLTALPCLVVSVWWAVYVSGKGFAMDNAHQELWFLLAGPTAAVTLPVAARELLASGRDHFSGTPVRA